MKIVCIGGGHGLSRVISSLQDAECQLTAIVTTTDNGGSTGRLRNDPKQIAIGDIRRCINTLAAKDKLVNILCEQRFETDNDLNGHSLGNIILCALQQLTHDAQTAIGLYAQLLGVKQTILPMSNEPVDLVASDKFGNKVFGECAIDKLREFPESFHLSREVTAPKEVIQAISEADLIILGPGSLLTSVLPPLLMTDIKVALLQSSACRLFIENLTTEGSVVDAIDKSEQLKYAVDLIGYKFFDVCLTPAALGALDIRLATKFAPANNVNQHNKEQLRFIIEQLMNHAKPFESSPVVH